LRTEEKKQDDFKKQSIARELKLTPFNLEEDIKITFYKGEQRYSLMRNTVTLDQAVADISRRFRSREHEIKRFDFGDGEQLRCPTEEEIRNVIIKAKDKSKINGNKLSEENKQQINLFFNQYLPSGKQRRVFDNIEGDIIPINTCNMNNVSLRASELDHEASVFLGEKYLEEIGEKNKMVLDYISQHRQLPGNSIIQNSLFGDISLLTENQENIRALVNGDNRPPFVVNNSIFKNPQSFITLSHTPERDFVFKLLNHYEYLDT
jgi:hypothetical protein